MNRPSSENPAAAWGCILCLTAIAIVAIIYGKLDLTAWFRPAPTVGRYQVVSGRIHNVFTTDEVPAMVKIDTSTGKSWVLFPVEVSSGTMHIEIPNRWEEITEPTPQPSLSPSTSSNVSSH